MACSVLSGCKKANSRRLYGPFWGLGMFLRIRMHGLEPKQTNLPNEGHMLNTRNKC